MALRAEDAAPVTPPLRSGVALPHDLGAGYDATFGRLQRMFRRKGLSAEDSADLAQETVTRTLLHLHRHGVRQDDLAPLMGRIARNLVVERARSRRPHLVSLSGAEALDDPDQDPVEHVWSRERQRAVRSALEGLNGRHRDALLLSLQGVQPTEIARSLGVKRNAADALLHRARRRLAEQLAGSRERLAGFVAVATLRIRSASRRITDGASSIVPVSVPMSQAIGTLVTAAVMGAVALSSPVTGVQTPDRVAPPPAAVSDAGAPATTVPAAPGAARTDEADGPDQAPLGTDVSVRDHRVGADATAPNPATGNDEEVELDIWHEREDGERGVAGPLLDEGTQGTCAVLVTLCDGGEG